jgi:hypothetical protein
LLSIIAIGLWNTMMMAVRERTPEIGALRAIGMSKGKVRLMIVAEATFLAMIASAAGAVLSGIMVAILNAIEIGVSDPILQFILMSDHLSCRVDPLRVLNAILFISVFAGVAALCSVACLFIMAARLAGDRHWLGWAAYTRVMALLIIVCVAVYGVWSTRASGLAGTFERLAIVIPLVWTGTFLRRLDAGAPFMVVPTDDAVAESSAAGIAR